MKKFSTLSILLLAGIFVSAQTIIINEKGFFINDVNVSENWQVSDFKNVLGEADRKLEGPTLVNTVHYYESKGIVFWEPMKDKKPTGKVIEIQIFYVHLTGPNDNKTKELFPGSASIDKLKISKSIRANDLKKALKTWTPQECYFKHGYKYSNGIVAINFGFNAEESELLWIDIVAPREFLEKEKPLAAGWLFFDEFEDNRNGWSIDTTNKDFQTRFSTGDYYFWNKRDDQSRYLLRKIPDWNEKNNFKIEITMHFLPGGPDNMGNGLIIGCDDKISNYYRIIINKNGSYRVDQSIIGKIVALQDWKGSTDILPYGDNKLGFTHINGQWAFYVNEKKIYEIKAKEFYGKGIGMFIGPGSSYYCRSLKVYDWTLSKGLPKYEKEPVVSNVFYDNFFDNRNEWLIKNDKEINITLNKKYTLQHKTEGFYYASQYAELNYSSDFLIEMELEHHEGTDDWGYGLVFGCKDMNSYYVFLIADGSYKINRWENDDQTVLKDWTENPVIKKGNYVPNLLQVIRMGDEWKFYVNRHLVTTTKARPGFGKYIGIEVQNKQKVSVNYIKAASLHFPE